MADLDHAFLMMEATHQILHEREPDYEDTLFVALTEVDCLTVGLAMACLWFDYPCLQHLSSNLQKRLLELAKEQKPHWVVSEQDDDGEE